MRSNPSRERGVEQPAEAVVRWREVVGWVGVGWWQVVERYGKGVPKSSSGVKPGAVEVCRSRRR